MTTLSVCRLRSGQEGFLRWRAHAKPHGRPCGALRVLATLPGALPRHPQPNPRAPPPSDPSKPKAHAHTRPESEPSTRPSRRGVLRGLRSGAACRGGNRMSVCGGMCDVPAQCDILPGTACKKAAWQPNGETGRNITKERLRAKTKHVSPRPQPSEATNTLFALMLGVLGCVYLPPPAIQRSRNAPLLDARTRRRRTPTSEWHTSPRARVKARRRRANASCRRPARQRQRHRKRAGDCCARRPWHQALLHALRPQRPCHAPQDTHSRPT